VAERVLDRDNEPLACGGDATLDLVEERLRADGRQSAQEGVFVEGRFGHGRPMVTLKVE
jgi:hypothetical protein